MNTQFFLETSRDTLLWGVVGYAMGHLDKTSPETVAVALATVTIAKRLFLLYQHLTYSNQLPDREKTIRHTYMGYSLMIDCITSVVLYRMKLMSLSGAFLYPICSAVWNVNFGAPK